MRYINELLAAQRVVGPCMDECQLAKIDMVEGNFSRLQSSYIPTLSGKIEKANGPPPGG